MIPETISAHIDFNDWLKDCPLEWVRKEITDENVLYMFILPEPETID